jgi:Rap1a immunity proteins
MMNRTLSAFAVFSFCVLSSADTFAASAERTDQLLWTCEGEVPIKDVPWVGELSCARYIDGILDMQALMVGMGSSPLFCLPPSGVSVDQATKIFIKWTNEHPEQLHETARGSVVVALRTASRADEHSRPSHLASYSTAASNQSKGLRQTGWRHDDATLSHTRSCCRWSFRSHG